jgi:hypothetical protein
LLPPPGARGATRPACGGHGGPSDDGNDLRDDRRAITNKRRGIPEDWRAITNDRNALTDDRHGINEDFPAKSANRRVVSEERNAIPGCQMA